MAESAQGKSYMSSRRRVKASVAESLRLIVSDSSSSVTSTLDLEQDSISEKSRVTSGLCADSNALQDVLHQKLKFRFIMTQILIVIWIYQLLVLITRLMMLLHCVKMIYCLLTIS